MRKFKLFFSIVLLALTIGCSSDDSQDEELEPVFFYTVTEQNECPTTTDTIKTNYCVTQQEYELYLALRDGTACKTYTLIDIFGDKIEGFINAASKGSKEPDCIPGGKVL
jgi:hypothetical protein